MLKEITQQYQNIVSQSMTGTATITSAVTDIRFKDSVSIQLQWTGTPVGTFYIEGSVDHFPVAMQSNGIPNAGTWIPIALSIPLTATGSESQALLDLNQLSFPYIRVRYVNTSGTGTLNGFIFGKSLG